MHHDFTTTYVVIAQEFGAVYLVPRVIGGAGQ
jgi:hypothetical protein